MRPERLNRQKSSIFLITLELSKWWESEITGIFSPSCNILNDLEQKLSLPRRIKFSLAKFSFRQTKWRPSDLIRLGENAVCPKHFGSFVVFSCSISGLSIDLMFLPSMRISEKLIVKIVLVAAQQHHTTSSPADLEQISVEVLISSVNYVTMLSLCEIRWI